MDKIPEVKYVRPKPNKNGRYTRSIRIDKVIEYERKKLERKLVSIKKKQEKIHLKRIEKFLKYLDDNFIEEDNIEYIYGLFDPENFELKYIGRTKNPKHRYKEHIRSGLEEDSTNPKSMWVRSLILRDLVPNMGIIERVIPEKVKQVESFWIQHYIRSGYDVVNVQSTHDSSDEFFFKKNKEKL